MMYRVSEVRGIPYAGDRSSTRVNLVRGVRQVPRPARSTTSERLVDVNVTWSKTLEGQQHARVSTIGASEPSTNTGVESVTLLYIAPIGTHCSSVDGTLRWTMYIQYGGRMSPCQDDFVPLFRKVIDVATLLVNSFCPTLR